MKQYYDQVSISINKQITNAYSTSFSLGVRCLHKNLQNNIYSIYGFVRLADEIVDSFDGYAQADLISRLEKDVFLAIEEKISINPILHSFQEVVNKYQIDHDLIHQFLHSMKMDLDERDYDSKDYDLYILGSAEVVGLMCLKVFCEGDNDLYQSLKKPAQKLGAAFQKINFLRDLKKDYTDLQRCYFPNLDMKNFNDEVKKEIEKEIELDFQEGYIGILKLPAKARFGVYLTYRYYTTLLKKIKRTKASGLLSGRMRIPNRRKYLILIVASFKHSLGLIK